jgi:hypothetical protein
MSVIDDLTAAVETYPKTNVQVQIEDVEFPNEVLNVNEEGSFKVRVTNNGPLNLTDVSVKVKGLNGVQVAPISAAGVLQWHEEFEEALGDVAGDGGSVASINFAFKAPSKPSETLEDLFKVSLQDWNANLDRILNAHTDPLGAVKDVFTSEVANL